MRVRRDIEKLASEAPAEGSKGWLAACMQARIEEIDIIGSEIQLRTDVPINYIKFYLKRNKQ